MKSSYMPMIDKLLHKNILYCYHQKKHILLVYQASIIGQYNYCINFFSLVVVKLLSVGKDVLLYNFLGKNSINLHLSR